MASRHKGLFSQKLTGIRSKFRQAFATSPAEPITPNDLALLERAADVIVRRDMATPALLFLESVGPMNFLGSQALHFLTPILQVVFPQRDVERVATLLERRDTLSRLAELIDSRERERRP
jgi:hypothetical protein